MLLYYKTYTQDYIYMFLQLCPTIHGKMYKRQRMPQELCKLC